MLLAVFSSCRKPLAALVVLCGTILGTGPVLAQSACTTADVVVYGGTPAGIAAAIQAARLKKDVILLEPTEHVGGMMSNGLNRTDVAPRNSVYGGIVLEFFNKAIAHYRLTDKIRVYFESKWAEPTFDAMLREAGVRVVPGQRVMTVTTVARKIKRITMVSRQMFCGSVFIDASYEADLMHLSGVTTILGRESRARYGESLAGVQALKKPTLDDGTQVTIDPYVVPGNPDSGLLPGLAPVGQRPPIGAADDSLMAFNNRVYITQRPDIRVPFPRPPDYDPLEFEAEARFIQALGAMGRGVGPGHYVGSGPTLLGKYDMNSTRYFSTNVWNIGHRYVTAKEAGREQVRKEIRNHILGLMWFATTDPRVPAETRARTATFGLCGDEFADNDNFPRQIYVRQSRRLVGQFVLTQKNLQKKTAFKDSIGLGYYVMDQHGMFRTAKNGAIMDETRDGLSVGSYQIPYRVMLPKSTQMLNLLVPVAVSSSHVAYTSIRVEPTYMVLGQAAGAAAALAENGNVSTVNIPKLQRVLKARGQVMK